MAKTNGRGTTLDCTCDVPPPEMGQNLATCPQTIHESLSQSTKRPSLQREEKLDQEMPLDFRQWPFKAIDGARCDVATEKNNAATSVFVERFAPYFHHNLILSPWSFYRLSNLTRWMMLQIMTYHDTSWNILQCQDDHHGVLSPNKPIDIDDIAWGKAFFKNRKRHGVRYNQCFSFFFPWE